MYYFCDYAPEADGSSGPVLPAGIGFLLVAAPGYTYPWGIFQLTEEPSAGAGPIRVSEQLLFLLHSAERFPPALAVARDRIAARFDGVPVSKEIFEAAFIDCLSDELLAQRERRYVFAKAVRDEIGYLQSGEFYWVLGHHAGSDAVSWVSADYFVYQNAASDFDLEGVQLEAI